MINRLEIKIIKGDITKIKADAIVNAANSSLMGGGGVDGAIHRAGGNIIHEECMKIVEKQNGCPTGEAVYTSAGNLPAKFVIHTVGPIWQGGNFNEDILLKNCYLNSLKLAEKLNVKSISFPNISTGVYGFPKERAALIAFDTVYNYESNIVNIVNFVCFDDENYKIYENLINNKYLR
ncbi:MAG: O-acetyl-ADP-ribose deacetylase [Melioribacteraceae bacterium]|nr:O-acetyl-ADP-ribose deacetylase [Melioribacteraceae bacterium]